MGSKTILFAAYVVSSVSGLAILKRFLPQVSFPLRWAQTGDMGKLGYLGLGAFLYVVSFALWLAILRSFPLITSYPVAVGLTICGTTAVSYLFLGEKLHLDQAAGIVLILLGAILTLRQG